MGNAEIGDREKMAEIKNVLFSLLVQVFSCPVVSLRGGCL